jgi:hypothetical protein
VGAALGGYRDITQALGASLGSGWSFRDRSFEASHEGVSRQHNEEVNRGSDQQERDECVQEISDHDVVNGDCAEVRLADDVADDRSNDILDKRCDDGAERCSHDYAYGQIEDVTAENKIPKSFEHVFPSKHLRPIVLDCTDLRAD